MPGIFFAAIPSVSAGAALATCVVTVSEYHRQFLISLSKNPELDIRIVHYGLDPSQFVPAARSQNDHQIQIISVGRLVEKKGFAYLVEACGILVKKGIPFRCLIVGEGPDRSIDRLINTNGLEDRVTLKGARNISEITELYHSSDIFALPCVIARSGDRDGMPNVLLEAMAMQLPVITTPVTGNPELVQDHVNGLLVPERDAAALAKALEILIADPELRARLGRRLARPFWPVLTSTRLPSRCWIYLAISTDQIDTFTLYVQSAFACLFVAPHSR